MNNNGKNVIVVRETWNHMSKVSGFDPLFSAIEKRIGSSIQNFIVPNQVKFNKEFTLWQRFWRKVNCKQPLQGQRLSPFVEPRHEKMAIDILRHADGCSNALIILSAGENQFSAKFNEASDLTRSRLVICLHQPPSWLRLHWRDFSCFNNLLGIICLSKCQRDFIANVCNSPTILIPHGVCHNFFLPSAVVKSDSQPRLLFVGQWLRDFETLTASMELIWSIRPEVMIDCVIIREARNHPALLRLARDERAIWHADISPEKLRELYQQATLLFLPLSDAVANNAIVEALASGLPIISTNVGGICDYVPKEAGELCPPENIEAHVQAVLDWLSDDCRRKAAGLAGRYFAEKELDWGRIASNFVEELQLLS